MTITKEVLETYTKEELIEFVLSRNEDANEVTILLATMVKQDKDKIKSLSTGDDLPGPMEDTFDEVKE